MFGNPHGIFGIPSPLFRVSFAVSTAKSPLTFMPLKPHCALATWSSKEAGNSQRRMIFILGKPFRSSELQVTRLDVLPVILVVRLRRWLVCTATQASTGSLLCGAPAKDMFGKPHGSFGIPSPLFRVSFPPSTAKSPLTFMPLKPHGASATWSSKEAGNSQRRMIFILGKPLGSGELQVMRLDVALLAMRGRCRSFLSAHWRCAMWILPHFLPSVWLVYIGLFGHLRLVTSICQRLAPCGPDTVQFRKTTLPEGPEVLQVVHHSMNAIPPAPVSSSSWRHGLLVAKIAVAQATRKHEHMRSIKTPEKEAPSFSSRTSMMVIGGGARLSDAYPWGLAQMCAAESTSTLPVEEPLKHGTPLALPLGQCQSSGSRGLPPGPRTRR